MNKVWRERPADCVFCARIKAHEYDASWLDGVTFEPLNPVTPGHRLFVSRDHESPLENPFGLHDFVPEPRGVGGVLPLLYAWRRDNRITEQFNLILNAGTDASQTIEHLHLHYIPRRPGDGLVLPWTHQSERVTSTPTLEPMAPFTCGLRIACGQCLYTACSNPEHPEFQVAPHRAIERHRADAHGEDASSGGSR